MPLLTDSERFIRYLAAKKYVDDRALSQPVWNTLRTSLPETSRRRPLKVIEMGGGIGTMFERVIDRRLAADLHYTMVEVNRALLDEFEIRLKESPFTLRRSGSVRRGLTESGIRITMETLCADIYDVISDRSMYQKWDVVMAHAVMDLVNIKKTLSGFQRLLRPGGLLYLSLNYDGFTSFLPPWDAAFEETLFFHYHRSMDDRTVGGRPSGSSQSGRQLILHLTEADIPLRTVGSSDWIVFPRNGSYSQDEACFLDMIIHTIKQQLQQERGIDQEKLERWTARRRAQIAAGELIFMARNLDILATLAPGIEMEQ